jgi:hypothetical protein
MITCSSTFGKICLEMLLYVDVLLAHQARGGLNYVAGET